MSESEPLIKEILVEVRRPEPGEVAISFSEGGHLHVIPGAKIVFFGRKEQIVFDSILEDRDEHPWRAPIWNETEEENG